MARFDIYRADEWVKIASKSGYKVAQMSKVTGISPRQLRRYTKKLFGRSPHHLLREQRLIAARRMLEEYRSVKSVCFLLGFKQLSHFSRDFRTHYGLSPTAFLALNAQVGKSIQRQRIC
jgi:AraC-like DNA-binding protein